MVDLNDFEKECECIYNGEHYVVRDNGAIFRNSRYYNHKRPTDNNWTFGKLNEKKGYLEIASVSIHRIIATAFHGAPPSKEHVVDHIDTNKQNNRPENLRWVTRLENILLNPITVKRIEIACNCSIEEFLDNPSNFSHKFQEPNYKWMCTVSPQEAKITKERLISWSKNDKYPNGRSLGKWIMNRYEHKNNLVNSDFFTNSIHPNSLQKNWKIPSNFPCCPQELTNNPINSYFLNLVIGKIFSENQYSTSIIVEYALSQGKDILWVLCKNIDDKAIKPYLLAEIYFNNKIYIHKNIGSFFKKEGAEKAFSLLQGKVWSDSNNIDDYL